MLALGCCWRAAAFCRYVRSYIVGFLSLSEIGRCLDWKRRGLFNGVEYRDGRIRDMEVRL